MKYLKKYKIFEHYDSSERFPMKYLKLFESNLKDKIVWYLREISELYDDDSICNNDHWDDCPFLDELLICHQKEYIENIFFNIKTDITLGEFREIYKDMLKNATEKILLKLTNNPELYDDYGEHIENLGIEVPSWIVNSNKYNL